MIPKFRAWDKGKKWMVYDVQDAYDGLWSEKNSDEVNDYYGFASNFQSFTDEEEFNFMQCTGLKDKDGVEIYEGDVVHWVKEFISPMDMRTKLKIDSNKEVHQKEGGEWGVGEEGNTLYKELLNVEVIGNIYENPELLEEEE